MSYQPEIRANQPSDQTDGKYRSQTQTLQKLFPAWSNDGDFTTQHLSARVLFIFFSKDLQSLLAEVCGDVELAATRIHNGK
jgi:hypothetical protein